ncbi:CPBP family intramembrane glutamic endopeptidase [Levilactobacillus tangyuanensis]|uniref:CPBP family intramembrane glutamic endopeptidase n=1 Tax=Levilactobacillus tangyuanensis TaxID=2486021 RepID=A0ABW1TN15_9LACO|nr:CPBP family intramembrane glutamic endopeptidase [Levilactobacillus tangyuanensis]
MKNRLSLARLGIQFAGFWLLWLIVQSLLNTPIERRLTGWPQEFALDAIKLIVWLGAAWWFIHRAGDQPLATGSREQWRPNWRFAAGYFVWGLVVVYLVGQAWLAHHGLRISPTFIPQYWGRYFLVVGVAEEFLFRGYFYNALRNRFSFGLANTIQALAFASMHIPRYLTTVPAMSPLAWITNLITVAMLGLLFGWLYERSHSLWPGIVVHMTWDILVTLLG